MALKHVVLISLVFAVFMTETPSTQAQVVPTVIDVVRVTLTGLRCTLNGLPTVGANANISLPFSGALVQLEINGVPVAVGVTDSNGTATLTVTLAQLLSTLSNLITPPTLPNLINAILNNGVIRVVTPLASCNATLPVTGTLASTLQLVGTTTTGLLRITSFIPTLLGLVV